MDRDAPPRCRSSRRSPRSGAPAAGSLASALALGWLALACASSGGLSGLEASCRNPAAAQSYLDGVVSAVLDEWRAREGERVRVRFSVASDGTLLSSDVIESTSDEAGRHALGAFSMASPFPAVPEQATCVAGVPFVGTLRASGRAVSGSDAPDYLRYVAWSEFGRGGRVMRWRVADMPLRVHLPVPPADMFPDPEAIWEVVRDGVVDWTDVAAPGVPSFEFVDDPGDADIPIVWAPVTQGWWVAFARYNVSSSSLVFGVDQVLVAARYEDGTLAQLDDLYMTMLHEIGHALGLAGHSPYSRDVMYPKGRWEQRGLSERDRNTLQLLYSKPIGHRVAGARRD